MNYAVQINGQSYTLTTNDSAQIAAITACRERYNEGKEDADKLSTDADYLSFVFSTWAASNPGFTNEQLQAVASAAFTSYAGQNPPEVLVQQDPPLTGDGLKAALKAYAASVRYARETGGMSINGAAIPTDRETQSKLQGAVLAFQTGALQGTIDWKAESGWLQLDQAAVTAIASAVAAHVQACFSWEKAISEQIDAEEITTKAEIDAA